MLGATLMKALMNHLQLRTKIYAPGPLGKGDVVGYYTG